MFNTAKRNARNGFTLIELLVVIAIIAILAAILFPVFAQAREKARQTSCLSNSKQISVGVTMYVQDYDETFPMMTYEYGVWNNPGPNRAWAQLVTPYIKNWQIHRCPSDPNANDTTLSAGKTIQSEKEFEWALRTDYGYNYLFFSPFAPPTTPAPLGGSPFVPVSLAAIGSPAATLMLADSIWDKSGTQPAGGGNWFIEAPCAGGSGSYYYFGGWVIDNPNDWLQFGGTYPRHNQMVNVAFADGHSKAMKEDALAAGCNVRTKTISDINTYIWDRL